MATKTTQASKKAFLASDLSQYLNADVDGIAAGQGQVNNILDLAHHSKLDAEQVGLYLDRFESMVKAKKLLTDASLKVAKSQRKFILEFALGTTKLQKAKPELWEKVEHRLQVMDDNAKGTGSLSAYYRALRQVASDEGQNEPDSPATKARHSLERMLKAGLTKADIVKILEAIKIEK